MAVRACAVTFTNHRGARHTVDVSADSLYEAAALAICELKRCEWVDVIGPGARLEVEVRQARRDTRSRLPKSGGGVSPAR